MNFRHFLMVPFILVSSVAFAGDSGKDTQAFIQAAAMHNLFEQELNTVALSKASNAEVKAFATQAKADHQAFSTELNWALAASKLDPALANVRMSAYQQQKMSELQVKSGRSFDSAYLDIQANQYEETLQAYEDYIDEGKSQYVLDYAKKNQVLLEKHAETLGNIKL